MKRSIYFTCASCKGRFEKAQVGRLKLLQRREKGEAVTWLCADCGARIGRIPS